MADQQLQAEFFLSWGMVVLALQAIKVAGYDKWDDLPFCAVSFPAILTLNVPGRDVDIKLV